jgi:hypothetical protein
MIVSPRPTREFSRADCVRPDPCVRSRWRLAAFAPCGLSAFDMKLLRRPRKRRAFGAACGRAAT